MALDSVPWFVGGGAEHSPDVARMVAYAATGGAAGVLGNLDFRVTELPVPTTKVRVAAGAATILNGYLPAPDFGKQSYIARAPDITDLDVTATGSGAGRTDLVVVRIDDPQFGGQTPVDPVVGPYNRFEIIENVTPGLTDVPAGLAYPAVALARITIPASTGTISQAMVTDLRKIARPRRTRDIYNTQPSSGTSASSTTTIDWCAQANRTIMVPTWATQMKVIGTVSGAVCRNAAAVGNVSFMFGSLQGSTVALDMDVNTRATVLTSDTLAIPAATRGTAQVLKLRANRASGTGLLQTDSFCTVLWDVEFLEVPSAD